MDEPCAKQKFDRGPKVTEGAAGKNAAAQNIAGLPAGAASL
jgi:hypothetical protein